MRIPGPTGFSSTRFSRPLGRIFGAARSFSCSSAFASGHAACADEQKVWPAGAYSFSDELGGFRITGGSGNGHQGRSDRHRRGAEFGNAGDADHPHDQADPSLRLRPATIANGILYMRIEVLNNSGQAWIEFEFELQEILDQPSVFGDGLSFDQRNKTPDNICVAATSPSSTASSSPMTGCCSGTARSTRGRRPTSTS